jgi:peptidoglycan hydrolase-like protein with peptidoglycan-binding domain
MRADRVTKEHRVRIIWVASAVLVLVVAGLAGSHYPRSTVTRTAVDAASEPSPATTTTTGPVLTMTATDDGPLVQPAPVVLPALPPGGLAPGASGPEVQAYQQRLTDLHFDPGAVDGRYGEETTYAIEALQKLMGTPASGTIREPERASLMAFRYPDPLEPDGEANRTEIDVTRQVITLYAGSQVRLITTTSTGSGENYCSDAPRDNPILRICEQANTPSGRFTFREYRDGWDRSPLGRLYSPFYFNGGIAVHGYPSVPTSPASHGCARIPMHIAEYFHTLVQVGDPVYVFGGTAAKILSSTPIETTTTTLPPAVAAPPSVPPPPQPSAAVATTTTTSTTTTTTTTLPPEPEAPGAAEEG